MQLNYNLLFNRINLKVIKLVQKQLGFKIIAKTTNLIENYIITLSIFLITIKLSVCVLSRVDLWGILNIRNQYRLLPSVNKMRVMFFKEASDIKIDVHFER